MADEGNQRSSAEHDAMAAPATSPKDKTPTENQQQSESPLPDQEHLDENRIVKHIMVIGFHHKHGYQVDYCYPPLGPGEPAFSTANKPITLPSCWKTLPLLCLPDGSHNYNSDAIYFTMPDLQSNNHLANNAEASQEDSETHEGIKTIFGTACYRQIQADKLLNRTDDMTRVAVQKSVCVLSTRPLFGLIRSKLEMITHAYFDELDFSKVKILKLTYENLNSLLSRDSVKENATFLGLSARHLVSDFGCNMLVLFKAMLLEKKILFYKSPVRDLCSTIMSMCSLFTGLLESGGLDYSTCHLQLSPTLLEALKLSNPKMLDECEEAKEIPAREDKVFFSPSKEEVVIISDINFSDSFEKVDLIDGKPVDDSPDADNMGQSEQNQPDGREQVERSGEYEMIKTPNPIVGTSEEAKEQEQDQEHEGEDERAETLADGSVVDDPYATKLCRQSPEECGLPLQIFTRGSFCLPYLSISYLDLLSDVRVRSFVIGATNFLFKQRKEMYDIVVDMEENTIIINDPNLKKHLSLTTEDLRFMDYLSRHVKLEAGQTRDDSDLISQDITKWVGGDEWIRYNFRLYTLYLLKAAKSQTNLDSFNSGFMQAWRQTTNNYKIWDATGKASVLSGLQSRHPFSSSTKGINFSDMKLKLSYAVNSSDKRKLINQTLNGIGKWSIWNNIASVASAAATTSTVTSSNLLASVLPSSTQGNQENLNSTRPLDLGQQQEPDVRDGKQAKR